MNVNYPCVHNVTRYCLICEENLRIKKEKEDFILKEDNDIDESDFGEIDRFGEE